MNPFCVPQNIALAISLKKDSHTQYTSFPGNVIDASLGIYVDACQFFLERYYRQHLQRDLSHDFLNGFFSIHLEALVNAKYHGSRKRTLFTHGLFLGETGVCSAFQDRGDFLRRRETKDMLEAREKVTDAYEAPDGESRGRGIAAYIYPHSDIISVDTTSGVLFCAQMFPPKL